MLLALTPMTAKSPGAMEVCEITRFKLQNARKKKTLKQEKRRVVFRAEKIVRRAIISIFGQVKAQR
jgi:hypothetical protein